MKTEILIEKIKKQFELTIDAGLLYKIHPDEFNTCFIFEDDEKVSRYLGRRNLFKDIGNNKEFVYPYLTTQFLNVKNSGRSHLSYGNDSFYEMFWEYWLREFEKIKATVANVPKYWEIEDIKAEDLIIINVKSIYQIKLFIINNKYITELEIGNEKLNHRIEHLILKDVKRIEASDEYIHVYFHGVHLPFSIRLENYKEVIKLQRQLLELRNKPFVQNNRNRR